MPCNQPVVGGGQKGRDVPQQAVRDYAPSALSDAQEHHQEEKRREIVVYFKLIITFAVRGCRLILL